MSNFSKDLHARVQEAEQIIASQNENLAALRHLLRIQICESVHNGSTAPVTAPTVSEPRTLGDVDFTRKQSEIVVALVQQSGEGGIRPRDIAEVLVERNLIKKGSNSVHTHPSELKRKELVKQKDQGLYIASAKTTAATPMAVAFIPAKHAPKKRTMSAAGREAIRKHRRRDGRRLRR